MEERWEFTVVFKGQNFIVIKGTLYKYHSRSLPIIGTFLDLRKEREEFFIKEWNNSDE